MRGYKNFLIIFLLFIVFYEAESEEIFNWTDCITEAKKNHPDLISVSEKINQAKEKKIIAESAVLPQITSNIGSRFLSTKDRIDTYSYGITARQLVFDGFKTSHEISSMEESIKSAQYNHEITSSNVRLRLRIAFIELLKAQELLSITEDIAKRRKNNVELVKLRYEAGREHKGALLTAEANLAHAEFEVSQSKRNINFARRRLNKELGRTKFSEIKVKGDFNIKDSDREKLIFETLAENNPSLRSLIAQKESVNFNLKSAEGDFFPSIYANVNTVGDGSFWSNNSNELSIGVSLSFPIFDWGKRTAEVSRLSAVFNQAKADEKSMRDSTILSLEDTWTKLQNAADNVDVQKKFLSAAEERSKIASTQYSNGFISFDNWIIIEDDLVKIKKSFLDALANALIAEANWIHAKGGTLDEK